MVECSFINSVVVGSSPVVSLEIRKNSRRQNFFVVSVIFVLSIITIFLWNAAKKVLMHFSLPGDNRLICLIYKEFII